MTASISDDVRAIEEALAAGPTQGPRQVSGTTVYVLAETARGPANRFSAQFQSARQSHEAQFDELAANADLCAACDPALLRRVLDTMRAMGEALRFYGASCDATESDPCGYEGNLCCKTARAALALYEGKQ